MKGRIIGAKAGTSVRSSTSRGSTSSSTTRRMRSSSRRSTASAARSRITLEKLIEDGRIHPARIEEMYYQSKAELDEHVRLAGEQAVFEANCGEFHEELVKVLGRLATARATARTSSGTRSRSCTWPGSWPPSSAPP